MRTNVAQAETSVCTPSPSHAETLALWVALALFCVLTLALIVRVPLGAAPDEGAHWDYIREIATKWRLPVFMGAPPPQSGYEYHQPPLYYLLCAPLWALLGEDGGKYAARGVSLLCGLGTLVFVWRAARELFAASMVPALAVLLVALSPLHQGVSAGVNNDGLAGLICAALFWLMARVWRDGPTRREALWMGALGALGIWTKTTTLMVSGVALVTLYLAAKRHEKPLGWVGAAFGLACVIALPLWVRNSVRYGDPFAYVAFSKAATLGTPGYPQFSQGGIDFFTYARGMGWMIFLTMWGFFGGPSTASQLTAPLNASGPVVREGWLLPLMLACVLAPLACALGWRRLSTRGLRFDSTWGSWLFATALVVLAWTSFAYSHFSGGQARYLHAALVPIAVALVAGWVGLWGQGRAARVVALLFGVILVTLTLLNVFVWETLV